MKYIVGAISVILMVSLGLWLIAPKWANPTPENTHSEPSNPAADHKRSPIRATTSSPMPNSAKVERIAERQIYGSIKHADHGSPVADAEIFLLPLAATGAKGGKTRSDADGIYRFENVLPGEYFLVGRYQRMLTFVHQDDLVPITIGAQDHIVGPMNLELHEGFTSLTVTVRDGERNEPVVNAQVNASSRISLSEATNQAGQVELTLSDDAWLIEATAPDYAKASQMIQPSQQTMNLTLLLWPGSTLGGQITDAQGNPIAHAQISIQGPGQSHRTTSNEQGHYRMTNLAKNTSFLVSISAAGYQKLVVRDFTLPTGKAALSKNWLLKPIPRSSMQRVLLAGQVIGPDDEPAENVKVLAQLGRNRYISQTTDAKGTFRFGNLQTGSFPLKMGAGGAGFAFRQFVVEEPPNDPLRIRLAYGDFVGGSVVDESGQPLSGVAIKVDTLSPGATFFDGRPFLSDETGRFLIEGLRSTDEPTFTFSARGYSTLYAQPLTLNSDQNRITLPHLSRIYGQVIDEQGEPIPAFNIRVFNSGMTPLDSLSPGELRLAREGLHFSNAEGKFRIDGLDANEVFSLYAHAKGFASKLEPYVVPMASEEARIRMTLTQDTIRAAGFLVDNAGQPIGNQQLQLEIFDETAAVSHLGDLPLDASAFHLGMIDLRTANSNEQGRFVFEDLPADLAMRIVVRRNGWRANPATNIQSRSAEQRENIVITMVPAAKLFGHVNLETYGARPELTLVSASLQDFNGRHTVVNENGAYAFENLAHQTYRLNLRGANDQGPIEETLVIDLSEGQAMELNLGFDQRYDLSGQIWIGDQPYAQGVFQVIPWDNGMQPLPLQRTNDSGQFQVSGLRNGQHRLRLGNGGEAAHQIGSNESNLVANFSIEGQDLVRNFQFPALGSLRGRIDPAPLQTAELVLIDHQTGHRKYRIGVAIDGGFQFAMISTGSYDLVLEMIYAEHSERKTLIQQIQIQPGASVNLGEVPLSQP